MNARARPINSAFGGIVKKTKYAQKITHFYCRPCGEYHHKTHPHYRAQKRRAARRKKNG